MPLVPSNIVFRISLQAVNRDLTMSVTFLNTSTTFIYLFN